MTFFSPLLHQKLYQTWQHFGVFVPNTEECPEIRINMKLVSFDNAKASRKNVDCVTIEGSVPDQNGNLVIMLKILPSPSQIKTKPF